MNIHWNFLSILKVVADSYLYIPKNCPFNILFIDFRCNVNLTFKGQCAKWFFNQFGKWLWWTLLTNVSLVGGTKWIRAGNSMWVFTWDSFFFGQAIFFFSRYSFWFKFWEFTMSVHKNVLNGLLNLMTVKMPPCNLWDRVLTMNHPWCEWKTYRNDGTNLWTKT